jgi:hypothetical protein
MMELNSRALPWQLDQESRSVYLLISIRALLCEALLMPLAGIDSALLAKLDLNRARLPISPAFGLRHRQVAKPAEYSEQGVSVRMRLGLPNRDE